MKLAHITAVCSSADHAKRFYHDLLGLEKIRDFSIDAALADKIFGVHDNCSIYLYGNGNFTVEIFIAESKVPSQNPFTHHCLKVPDKESFLQRCTDAGLTVNPVPKGEKTLFFIEDFDGNLFEIT